MCLLYSVEIISIVEKKNINIKNQEPGSLSIPINWTIFVFFWVKKIPGEWSTDMFRN